MRAEDLYCHHYGFRERPFALVPDPAFLYWTAAHRRAYAILEFGVMSRAPITLITGEIGAGKTMLVHHLIGEMAKDITVGLIANIGHGEGDLMPWILHALARPCPPDQDCVGRMHAFEAFAIGEYAEGRRIVLIVDEAQVLSPAGLEQLRMITNLNANKDELVQVILVGQPELRDRIECAEMRQFAQRIATTFHLGAMERASHAEYIGHRLRIAGGDGGEFTPQAVELIYEYTAGLPRLINQLCDFALLYAWTMDQRRVTDDVVRAVLAEGVFFGARPHLEAAQ